MFSGAVNPARLILVVGVLVIPGISGAAAAEVLRGKVTAVAGKAELVFSTGRKPAAVGMEVSESDRIETGVGGAIQVRFADGSSFTVYEKSRVKIDQYREASQNQKVIDSVIDVLQGKLRFFVNPSSKQKKNAKFKTKSAVMGIRGTSGLIDAVNPNQTQILVLTGRVEVFNPKFPRQPVFVGPNLMTSIPSAAAPAQPVQVSSDFVRSFLPETPAAAGFSDDSAAAASEFFGKSSSEEKQSKPNNEKQSNPNNEKQSNPNNEKQSNPNNEKLSNPNNEKEEKQFPQKDEPKNEGNTQRGKTLFAPGGEVIRPGAEPNQKSGVTSSVVGGGGNASNRETTNLNNSENPVGPKNTPASPPDVDVIRQVERTTSQVKTTVESTERAVQQTIKSPTTPAPAQQKIKIKVNLPEN
jgi:hypothetical protein